jgi:hypothetical protein
MGSHMIAVGRRGNKKGQTLLESLPFSVLRVT